MNIKKNFILSFHLTFFLCVFSLFGTETIQILAQETNNTSDREAVRWARLEQNNAMAAGDVERAASFWTDDVTMRRGLGASISGKEAYRAIIELNPTENSLIYRREPESIEISQQWPLAFETGTWTAYRGSLQGKIIITGRYSAQWVKREENWLIRSELFVALSCGEEGCDLLALP